MSYIAKIRGFKIAHIVVLTILLTCSPILYAETADELYARGFKEYQGENFVAAFKFLAAYKYHPDSKKADAEKLKSVDDAIQAIENKLKMCTNVSEKQSSGGGGGSFHGRAVLRQAPDY